MPAKQAGVKDVLGEEVSRGAPVSTCHVDVSLRFLETHLSGRLSCAHDAYVMDEGQQGSARHPGAGLFD